MYKTFKYGLILSITYATVAACDTGNTAISSQKKTNQNDLGASPGNTGHPDPSIDLSNDIKNLFPDGATLNIKLGINSGTITNIVEAIPKGAESEMQKILKLCTKQTANVKVRINKPDMYFTNEVAEVFKTQIDPHSILINKTAESNLIVITNCEEYQKVSYIYKDKTGKYITKQPIDGVFSVNSTKFTLGDYFASLNRSHKLDSAAKRNRLTEWVLQNIDNFDRFKPTEGKTKGKYELVLCNEEQRKITSLGLAIIDDKEQVLTMVSEDMIPYFHKPE